MPIVKKAVKQDTSKAKTKKKPEYLSVKKNSGKSEKRAQPGTTGGNK
jgi:hypothetical protein